VPAASETTGIRIGIGFLNGSGLAILTVTRPVIKLQSNQVDAIGLGHDDSVVLSTTLT
jgi:hypothetical protein